MSKEHLLKELKITESEAKTLRKRVIEGKLTEKDTEFINKAFEFMIWLMELEDTDLDDAEVT